jgi:signal peptide peptidase SppA
MPRNLVHIAGRLFNRPLLVLPETAITIASVLAQRLGVEPMADIAALGVDAFKIEARILSPGREEDERPYQVNDGTAVIPVRGELVNRGSWLSSASGLTSYEQLGATLRQAAADDEVTGILLDIDSPGGEAAGAFETAALVREIAGTKPVTAFVNDLAASAAYAIASGATRIVATPSSTLGSIGVVVLHMDRSAALAEAGLKPTLIKAGDFKTDGNPMEPLSKEARGRIQAMVDEIDDMFAETVAAHRPSLSVDGVKALQAGVFIGASAVKAGLADQLGTLDDAYSTLSQAGDGPYRIGATMADTKTISQAEHETALAAARQEGTAAASGARAEGYEHGVTLGTQSGAKAERERVQAILGSDEAKGREQLARHFAFATEMAPEAAIAALKVSPKAEAPALEAPATGAKATLDAAASAALAAEAAAAGNKPEGAKDDRDEGAAAFASAFGKKV